jgi:signal transduction histidine kinase/DNA-binding response OmpR family regulator
MSEPDKVNILVVDDMPDKLLALQAILEDLGQNIVVVSSGREALRRLLEMEFAMVLLDVNMPDMDGFETAALIRQRKKLQHTPIIFVTSYSDETHAWQGYSLGAVDYILAPVIPEVLRAKVGVFVDLYRKNQLIQFRAEERVALAREQVARAAAEALSRRTAFLADAGSQLARSLDLDATISTFLNLVIENTADAAGLCLLSERQHCNLIWRASEGADVKKQQLSLTSFPESLSAAIERSHQLKLPLELKAADLGEWRSQINVPADATVTILPLSAGLKSIGVFWQIRWRPDDKEFDNSLIEALVARAAIAIDNARLYHKIKEGDRRKDEFLAMLGHELRNPLAAIYNALECLRLAQDDKQISDECQQILARQVKQMSRLVDDLLDVSRITQGKVELRKEVIDLATIVGRAVEVTASSVAARAHQLTVTVPRENMLLLADPTRVEQILANLINNAAKYTEPQGKLSLAVEKQRGHFVIRVSDNGIGISEKLLPHIFDLFTQGDRSLDRSQGGLGIGLTLVQRLVEMHGGTVAVTSGGAQRGTEFTVKLPEYVQPHASRRETCEKITEKDDPVARRVLLVDDNQDLLATVSALMRRVGHEVHVAHDGPSALEIAAAWQPEVMLIDIGLPGLDGYEVARRIRKLAMVPEIYLVAVTGYGQHEDRQRAHEAGFHHHLVKPVAFEELQRVLAQCPSRSSDSVIGCV